MRFALIAAVLLVAAVFSAEAVKNSKRRAQRKALRLNQKGVITTLAPNSPSMAPQLKPSKVCIPTDKILTGDCYPWVYAATVARLGPQNPLAGKVVVVRDTVARKTWIEAEITGVSARNFHLAVAYNFPCNIQRGGPFPYQHLEHGAAYGLQSYIDNDGNLIDGSGIFPVEFQGNLLNATRPNPNAPFPSSDNYNGYQLFNNEGQFDYIARNEIQSVVIFEGTEGSTRRIMCCNLYAEQNKPKVVKDKKETTTEAKKTTKKQAN